MVGLDKGTAAAGTMVLKEKREPCRLVDHQSDGCGLYCTDVFLGTEKVPSVPGICRRGRHQVLSTSGRKGLSEPDVEAAVGFYLFIYCWLPDPRRTRAFLRFGLDRQFGAI